MLSLGILCRIGEAQWLGRVEKYQRRIVLILTLFYFCFEMVQYSTIDFHLTVQPRVTLSS